jgi:hypothetical protein
VNDGSNEAGLYTDTTGYSAVNDPMILVEPYDATDLQNPNRWQPLAFDTAMTQNGQVADKVQHFIGPHWGGVTPFGMTPALAGELYFDPGMPPQLGGADDAAFKENNLAVLRFSRLLDPDQGTMIDLSPGVRGNNTLGFNDGVGHGLNPVTAQAYATNEVNHADYGRVVAEFWADGPHSETPPGHWNVLFNEVSADPLLVKQIEGSGPVVSDLEWDVKGYFALNGAVHDAAIAAWGAKAAYDYIRPISSIRYMAALGQSTDAGRASYHPSGIPLEDGLVEEITSASVMIGQRHNHLIGHIGKIAVYCWPGEPDNPATEYGGAEWILATTWLPYQRDTFVTPAFAGYVSGHSCFSRSAAEVLAAFTGSPYFPGGLGEHTVAMNALDFELGPTTNVTLQWASYFDAADEAGISRLYGGIHVAPDDGPGRIIGSRIGIQAMEHARRYWQGSILNGFSMEVTHHVPGSRRFVWPSVPGERYRLRQGPEPDVYTVQDPYTAADGPWMEKVDTSSFSVKAFFRIEREVLP